MEHTSAIKRSWGLTLVVFSAVAALCGNVRCDPPDCSNQYAEMAPCLPFVQGQESPPADACCKALGDVRKNSPVCLCMLVAPGSPGTSVGGGIPGLNTTLELMLPSLCKVQADPSQCSRLLNGSPQSAPSSSPKSAGTIVGAPVPVNPPASQPSPASYGGAAAHVVKSFFTWSSLGFNLFAVLIAVGLHRV
jgi:hypothetical protein